LVAVPSKGRADQGLQRLAPEAVATRELYERYARQIYAFCLNRLRSREEAEDATQSTFLNAFRGLKRGIEPEHDAAWLYKIAENVCLTRGRSRLRRARVESPGDLDAIQDVLPSPPREMDALIGLPEALEGMPEHQRRALLLREWRGLSYKEIADELELSHSAVETLLFRARRSLARGLSVEPKRIAKRLRAGTDLGSLAALVKTLFFSGGAKVVGAALAVAAGSVVAASPSVRHTLEHTVVPAGHGAPAAPVVTPHRSVPVAPATIKILSAPPVRRAARPVHHARHVSHVVVVHRHARAIAAPSRVVVTKAKHAHRATRAFRRTTVAVAHGSSTVTRTSAPGRVKKVTAATQPAPAAAARDQAKKQPAVATSKATHAPGQVTKQIQDATPSTAAPADPPPAASPAANADLQGLAKGKK
jgi:RNA polymerase sigma factor (sigma-70 family)